MQINEEISFKEKIRSINFAASTFRVADTRDYIGDKESLDVFRKSMEAKKMEGRTFMDPVEQAMQNYV